MWNILWMSLLLSEVLTAIMNTVLGYLWWGKVSLDLILIGTIDAFFVAGIVTAVVLLLFREYDRVEKEAAEDRQKVAAMEERGEVSLWLHDNLGSDLFNISLLTDTIRQKQVEGTEAEEYIERITDASRNALNSIRSYLNFSEQVGPAAKDLVGYMRDYGQDVLGKNEIEFRFTTDLSKENFPLLPMKGFSVYMIYKEALTNILKHSGASKVEVCLTGDSGSLQLGISDNGRGFSADDIDNRKYGTRNISTRAERIGGRVKLRSRPGEGTSVQLTVPV
jgi:signal transduction histidine kinase